MTFIWNTTRSLAAWRLSPRERATLNRIERNRREKELAAEEHKQLNWRRAPGRRPYAGAEH